MFTTGKTIKLQIDNGQTIATNISIDDQQDDENKSCPTFDELKQQCVEYLGTDVQNLIVKYHEDDIQNNSLIDDENVKHMFEYFRKKVKEDSNFTCTIICQVQIDNSDPNSQYSLGEMYYNGDGVEQDYSKAIEYYEMAANQGHAEAQFALGFLYENGDGVEQDYSKALKLLEMAAKQGHDEAQHHVGAMYYTGSGVPQDYSKAFEYYEMASKQGHAISQFTIGAMYYIGEGVEQNYSKAIEYYEMASKQGHADAQYSLGLMYDIGEGVEVDLPKAMEYFEMATKQGHAEAQKQVEKGKAHNEKNCVIC